MPASAAMQWAHSTIKPHAGDALPHAQGLADFGRSPRDSAARTQRIPTTALSGLAAEATAPRRCAAERARARDPRPAEEPQRCRRLQAATMACRWSSTPRSKVRDVLDYWAETSYSRSDTGPVVQPSAPSDPADASRR